MKKFLKVCLFIVAGIFMLVLLAIIGHTWLSARSLNELKGLVKECSELAHISEVENVMGKAKQVIDDSEYIKIWLDSQTDLKDYELLDNSKLYLYVHGIPFRWMFVIIDGDSQKVLKCDWTDM